MPPRLAATAPLPTRRGVGPSTVGLPAGEWPTLLDFLLARFPGVAEATWRSRMHAGDVVDEKGRPVQPAQPYRPHQRLYYYREIEDEPRIPVEERVLFQDAHLLVADKPHFLPVTPTGKYLQESLLVRLKRRLGIDTLAPIHRIDRGTAGLVLFCVDPAGRAAYQKLFADRGVRKQYEAIVHWPSGVVLPAVRHSRLVPDASFLRTAEVAGEPNSTTHFELLERIGDDHARLRLSPVTGRKHQLRVHCNALGMPLVNDPVYPVLLPAAEDDHAAPLKLLARQLSFRDPVTGALREFQSTLTLDA
ncbi:pseudouridine synthase [Variovorax ginsengisoli]|uniref:tRNA pseudouridine32 synthase/23S rRNA pseudouridine746 synthase n=1 Tax=Variovorax ginsengisoli TaxID=363844 RepID=A0ABT9SDX1_9BURK|nr:pseudouridine synthase [Variovorax ginsengisoli]MDP9902549.1 tRNA pseudouridine32 synthase/23S rRNA pseudouridine746 synthase [Variovorax ginsengisoli]